MSQPKPETTSARVLTTLAADDLSTITGATKRRPRPIIRIPGGRDIYGRPKFPLPLPPKGPRKI